MQRLCTRRETLALAAALPLVAAAPAPRRVIAIGDLHGDFIAWRAIAVAAGLVDAGGRWAGGETVLVQTGDVVDRGPDSLKILQDLMRLVDEARSAGGRVIPLVGNHEAMNMTGDLRYVPPASYAAFADKDSESRRARVFDANRDALAKAYRAKDPQMSDDAIRRAWYDATPLGNIEYRIAWRPDGKIGRWVAGNPAVVLMDDTLFLHGGISPAYVTMWVDEMNARVRAALLAQNKDPKAIINDPLGPLWYRGLTGQQADDPPEPPVEDQLKAVLSAYGVKRVVIGHTPILTGIAMLYDNSLIRIDTGISAVFGGTLSWLEILDGNPTPHAIERPKAN